MQSRCPSQAHNLHSGVVSELLDDVPTTKIVVETSPGRVSFARMVSIMCHGRRAFFEPGAVLAEMDDAETTRVFVRPTQPLRWQFEHMLARAKRRVFG